MKILVLCPMQEEYVYAQAALKKLQGSLKHTYQILQIGVGKVESAVNTALEVFDPSFDCDLVALIGFAASSNRFTQGSFVVPSFARYHDVNSFNFPLEFDRIYPLISDDLDSDEVTILTGDSFVDQSLSDSLVERFGNNTIYDMEAAAVAQVCNSNPNNPIPLKVLKIISDTFPKSVQSFEEFVETHSDFSSFFGYLELL